MTAIPYKGSILHFELSIWRRYPQKEQQPFASGMKLAPQLGHSFSLKTACPFDFIRSGWRALHKLSSIVWFSGTICRLSKRLSWCNTACTVIFVRSAVFSTALSTISHWKSAESTEQQAGRKLSRFLMPVLNYHYSDSFPDRSKILLSASQKNHF